MQITPSPEKSSPLLLSDPSGPLIPPPPLTGCSGSSSSRASTSGGSSKSSSPPTLHWEPVVGSHPSAINGSNGEDGLETSVKADSPLTAATAVHPLLMTTQGLALQQHVQQLLRDQLIHPQVLMNQHNPR